MVRVRRGNLAAAKAGAELLGWRAMRDRRLIYGSGPCAASWPA